MIPGTANEWYKRGRSGMIQVGTLHDLDTRPNLVRPPAPVAFLCSYHIITHHSVIIINCFRSSLGLLSPRSTRALIAVGNLTIDSFVVIVSVLQAPLAPR